MEKERKCIRFEQYALYPSKKLEIKIDGSISHTENEDKHSRVYPKNTTGRNARGSKQRASVNIKDMDEDETRNRKKWGIPSV